jgi:hypothetical protein
MLNRKFVLVERVFEGVKEVRAALTALAQERKAALDTFEQPQTLFHYTNAPGLWGILHSDALHMTADIDAKDPLELHYASTLLRDTTHSKKWDWAQLENMNPYLSKPQAPAPFGIYIASLCAGDDIPHHWQNFANGGRGFSIGFRTGIAEQWTTTTQQMDKLLLEPVIYEPLAQQRLIQDLLGRAEQFLATHDSADVAWGVQQVMGDLLPFFKDPSFRQENEWRFVAARLSDMTPADSKVQVLDGNLTAVLELRQKHGGRLPISTVRVGPRMPRGTAGHVQALLEQHGHDDVQLLLSKWQLA